MTTAQVARDAMVPEPFTLDVSATASEAGEVLSRDAVRAVLVTDGGRLVGVVTRKTLVRDVDAVFFATPEYNSSVPGALKNALDWASRPIATNAFRNKPVAVISSSAGAFGGVWAAAELRKVLAAMGARVTDAELSVGHAAEKFEDGRLVDDDVRQGLRDALQTLVAEVPSAIAA